MAVDLWVRMGHEADSAPPCWGWGWGCALSCRLLGHSERLSVISPFLALFRSGEGFSPQPEVTEEGWKHQGRRRAIWGWTMGLWLDLSLPACWQNGPKYGHPPLLPPLVSLFSIFLWIVLLSSPLSLVQPLGTFPGCLRMNKKNAKTNKELRESKGFKREDEREKGPLRKCSQKYLTSLSPLFSVMITPLSWFFSTHSDHLPTKISHCRGWRKVQRWLWTIKHLNLLSFSIPVPYPPPPWLLHLPFTLSFLAPFHCFPSLPSNRSLAVYGSDSGWLLMSSEMWSRDHSETGRHRPSPNSHHSSIIHTGFHLWDEDFYFEVRFIFHVLKRRVAAFLLTKDICVCSRLEEVSAHGRSRLWGRTRWCCSHCDWAAREHGKPFLRLPKFTNVTLFSNIWSVSSWLILRPSLLAQYAKALSGFLLSGQQP